jgi:hypothetical protein
MLEILLSLPPDQLLSLVEYDFLGLSLLGGWLFALVRKNLKSTYAQGMSDRFASAFDVAVPMVHQIMVKHLKAGAADGKLESDDAQEAASLAIATAKRLVGEAVVKELEKSKTDAELFLRAQLEAAVSRHKAASK